MSFHQLDPELWLHILSFLAPTLPRALSGCTQEEHLYVEPTPPAPPSERHLPRRDWPDATSPGVTSRRDIRAPELARLMRTSIAFNHLASLHLYRTVITDDFLSLIAVIDHPAAHPLLASKSELLHLIRGLHLEYSHKGVEADYLALMKDGRRWRLKGAIAVKGLVFDQGGLEVDDTLRGLTLLQREPAGTTEARFPNLVNLSIGAIFGGQNLFWSVVRKADGSLTGGEEDPQIWMDDTSHKIARCADRCGWAAIQVFRKSPVLQYCQRSFNGPLAAPVALDWASAADPFPAPTSPLFTFHYHPAEHHGVAVRAAIGQRTRWVLENGFRSEFTTNNQVRSMSVRLRKYLDQLEVGWDRKLDFDIEVYASSNRYSSPTTPYTQPSDIVPVFQTTPANEKSILIQILRTEAKQRRKFKYKLDGVRMWRTSSESPSCKCCNWAFDENALYF